MVLWLNMGKTCPLGAQAGPWAFQRCVVFTQFLKPGRGMTSQKNQRHTSVPGLMRTIQSLELKPSVAERVLGPSQREQRLCSQL